MDRKVQRIAVVMPKWVGDCIMATPTLRALRRQFPEATITAISKGVAARLLQPTGLIDDWVAYRSTRDLLLQARGLRKQSTDVTISLPSSLSTGMATWLTGATQRIGYRREGRHVFLNHSLPYATHDVNGEVISDIDRFLTLAEMVGCDISDRHTELCVTNEDRLLCNRMLDRVGLTKLDRLVVVNSSAAVHPAKQMPDGFLRDVCRRVCEESSVSVLLHCGPGEEQESRALEEFIDHPRVRTMGRFSELPIGLSVAVMERADLVITSDSGPRHMAAALKRPLISIYGPTDSRKTRQSNCDEAIVEVELDCRPCFAASCPLGHHRCMKDLSAAHVSALSLQKLELPTLEAA